MNTPQAPRCLKKPFHIIAAVDQYGNIGDKGKIPWSSPADLKHFRNVTTRTSNTNLRNAVIMGRKTWETLQARGPLSNRLNVVISRTMSSLQSDNLMVCASLLEAYQYLVERGDIEQQFIIGGGQIYKETITCNWAHTLTLTTIQSQSTDKEAGVKCDTVFPALPDYWQIMSTESLDSGDTVSTYHNRYTRHLEEEYVFKMRELSLSTPRTGRNGKVQSKFQWHFEMDLADGLPLFSTRRSFWKGICKELLFFIRGDTDSKHLEAEGVRIWEDNTTTTFLHCRSLPYEEGDMGPMYGWNWRHFGADYKGKDADYTGQGFDQLRDLVNKIITDPYSRRILLTTYDPSKVKESVLAPCHGIACQFYVRDGHLDMYTYQRSADMFLGVNFNIPSYATLQTIIATATGLKPGRMYYQFGDHHIYNDHREALEKLLSRTPNDTFPTLEISKPLSGSCHKSTDDAMNWIKGLRYEDFHVHDYKPQPGIKAKMVA